MSIPAKFPFLRIFPNHFVPCIYLYSVYSDMNSIKLIPVALLSLLLVLAGCAGQQGANSAQDANPADSIARADGANNGIAQSMELKAQEYCGAENVAGVFACKSYIEVQSSLLGGGSKYYLQDGSQLECPLVALEYMSAQCRELYENKEASAPECKQAC